MLYVNMKYKLSDEEGRLIRQIMLEPQYVPSDLTYVNVTYTRPDEEENIVIIIMFD